MTSTYEGWSNRETWTILLWIDNEEYSYRAFWTWAKKQNAKGRKMTGVQIQTWILNNLYDANGDISIRNGRIHWGEIAKEVNERAADAI